MSRGQSTERERSAECAGCYILRKPAGVASPRNARARGKDCARCRVRDEIRRTGRARQTRLSGSQTCSGLVMGIQEYNGWYGDDRREGDNADEREVGVDIARPRHADRQGPIRPNLLAERQPAQRATWTDGRRTSARSLVPLMRLSTAARLRSESWRTKGCKGRQQGETARRARTCTCTTRRLLDQRTSMPTRLPTSRSGVADPSRTGCALDAPRVRRRVASRPSRRRTPRCARRNQLSASVSAKYKARRSIST